MHISSLHGVLHLYKGFVHNSWSSSEKQRCSKSHDYDHQNHNAESTTLTLLADICFPS